MRSFVCAVVVVVAIVVSSCGGDSEPISLPATDAPNTVDTAAPEPTFAASTMSGEDICFQINPPAVLTVLGVAPGTIDVPLPNDTQPVCQVSTWNPETEVTNEVEFSVRIVNAGGQAGYDAELDRWSALSDVNQPLSDIADQANYFEGAGGQRVVMLLGDRVIDVSSGPIYLDSFNADTAPDVATVVAGSF